ncbi:hypothetical protein TRIUR3_34308 [Triticum urartu]|uniref:Uncharacterized protein n=1 Tax=Triticum urartu TaxID=4572 RepID=M7ZXW7_TRIUA|nr:hypothetical protein TRIUR3_34308 [Triticum urartu]
MAISHGRYGFACARMKDFSPFFFPEHESMAARSTGSSSRSAALPPAAPQAGAANPLRFDAKTIHFSVNAWALRKVPRRCWTKAWRHYELKST